MRNGDWEDWELTGARSCLANGHRSIFDSASQLEDFYMGQVATGRNDDPEALLEAALAVTPERIRAAAGREAGYHLLPHRKGGGQS